MSCVDLEVDLTEHPNNYGVNVSKKKFLLCQPLPPFGHLPPPGKAYKECGKPH